MSLRFKKLLTSIFLLTLTAFLFILLGTNAYAQNASIIVHALNSERIEIASIQGVSQNSVEIYDGDTLIGYGAYNADTHNRPIQISTGVHTIKVKFNGITKEQSITLSPNETKALTFNFERTVFDLSSYFYGCDLSASFQGSYNGLTPRVQDYGRHISTQWWVGGYFNNDCSGGNGIYSAEAKLQFSLSGINYNWYNYAFYHVSFSHNWPPCPSQIPQPEWTIETSPDSGKYSIPSKTPSFTNWYAQYHHSGDVKFFLDNSQLNGQGTLLVNSDRDSTLQVILGNPLHVWGGNAFGYDDGNYWNLERTFGEGGSGTLDVKMSSVPYDILGTGIKDEEIIKIPLGKKEFPCTDNEKTYRIYVPSRYGGTLTVSTDAGVIELFYPNSSTKIAGSAASITHIIPLSNHGWYYVKYSGAASCNITNTFEEKGEASYRPWNFWYYPLEKRNPPSEHPDWKLNLYTEDGALDKYDALFGTKAREYEEKKYSSGEDWWGHCWGGSVASILVPQPQLAQSFNQEEVEGLVTKLANGRADRISLVENIPSIRIVNGQEIPVRPQSGTDETDEYASKFHKGLLEYLRLEKLPLQSNLRDPLGRNNKAAAIWHHAIYKYASTMEESDEGKEDIIKITTTIFANSDIFPSEDKNVVNSKEEYIDRRETYVYKLKYTKGNIDEEFIGHGQDWISATHFAPAWLWFIKGSLFDGKSKLYNPEVKKRNVEKLGIYFP